jgi:hypothetical protein
MTGIGKSHPAKPTKPRCCKPGGDAKAVNSAKESLDPKRRLTGELLIAAMQASPHRDIDVEPERGPMPTRKVVF